ncbi:MAG: nitroreductase family protein [Halioglobus sp.]
MAQSKFDTIALAAERYPETEMLARAQRFREESSRRRTVRDFSSEPVPREIIEQCLLAAGSAPSGAHRQPWHFCVVSNSDLKRKIREGAEEEEREFYQRRAPDEWLEALAPLGTDEDKPFLETAPYLIVIFAQKFSFDSEGRKQKNYYVPESVGIATGMLISALHQAGLASLTHTPSPMKFLNEILDRPNTEKPSMILVVGYPTEDARVPDIQRKSLAEIASFLE